MMMKTGIKLFLDFSVPAHSAGFLEFLIIRFVTNNQRKIRFEVH